MNIIFKIAKTELRNLFYSPIAWFLMIVFLVQGSLSYLNLLENAARMQEMGGPVLQNLGNLTAQIFTGKDGVLGGIIQNLYLYIPLLTMGLISREINGGTIKLLYTSPVSIRDIVLGKYLGMIIFSFVLVLIVALFEVMVVLHVKDADWGILLSAGLGFFLIICSYSAIGLFMSTLSTHQVIAAVSTFIMIGILSYIGTLWQEYDFVRDLTYFLSLSGRAKNMLGGLITSKDVIYFLVIISLFISLTILKLKGGMESSSLYVKTGKYTIILVAALFIGYLSSRPAVTIYWDVTALKKRTLTPNAQRILKELGTEKLEVTLYGNLLGMYNYYAFPVMRNMYLGEWENYTRFRPDIIFKYVNYYDEDLKGPPRMMFYPGKSLEEVAKITAKSAKMDFSRFKTPEEIHKIIDLKPEFNRIIMQLKYKNRTEFLRFFTDQMVFPSEVEISAALKRLITGKIPKVAFVTGNLERNAKMGGERDYTILTSQITSRMALVNQGFDIDSLPLVNNDIPSNISTLVIADPKTELSADVLAKIHNYIKKGGNLLILGEPGKQAMLNPLLSELGVQMMEGRLVQPSKELPADLIRAGMTPFASKFTKNSEANAQEGLPAAMLGVAGLSYTTDSGFNVQPLLMTNENNTWNKKGKLVLDSAAIVFSAAQGDVKQFVPTVLALTRNINGKEQRIIVSGDADFMSNKEVYRSNIRNCNFDFDTSLFSWLSYGEYPIDATRPKGTDNRLKITTEGIAKLRIALVWVLPVLIAAFAAILLIRRKRK